MALHPKREDIKERQRSQPGDGEGAIGVKKSYGNGCSLMIAVRPPGYRSRRHYDASDQIICVLQGEQWRSIEDRGVHRKTGDLLRIPANKIQRGWNRSEADSVVVETHAPMIGGPSGDGAAGLFADGETPDIKARETKLYVDCDYIKAGEAIRIDRFERKIIQTRRSVAWLKPRVSTT